MMILNYRITGVLIVLLSCISNQLLAKTKAEILSSYNDPAERTTEIERSCESTIHPRMAGLDHVSARSDGRRA